jgi:hypothetical protein
MLSTNNFKFRCWVDNDRGFVHWSFYDHDPVWCGIIFGKNDPQQFTGLFDKADKEIYVGDYIFNVDDMEFYEVLFYKGMYVIKIADDDYSPLLDYISDSIVAGNVHSTNLDTLKNSLG